MKTIMRFKRIIYFFSFLFIITFISCEQNNSDEIQLEGIYIVNEGQFNNNNGSITVLDPETNAVSENYFQQQNSRSLGDIVQDLSFHKGKGYIVVNNSKKLEIIDKETFETIDVIGDLSYPRQFLAVSDDKGYLTDGASADGSNAHVLVIDLQNHTITDSIEVGKGPESMVLVNDHVYVSNAGGHSFGNTVSVISTADNEVVETIEVTGLPTDLVVDKNQHVWVYCKGNLNWDTFVYEGAQLVKINSETYATQSYDMGTLTAYGNYLLAIDGNQENLYFTGVSGIYKMSIDATRIPESPVINKISYGLDVNPVNDEIYCLMTTAQSKGMVYRYDKNHNLLDSAQVGYAPNAVVFE
jgi:hypothetical protein